MSEPAAGAPPRPSHARGPALSPLRERTVGDDLARAVTVGGEREAVVDRATGRRLTYRALADEADALAAGLVARGIGHGDRVGILAPNSAEWVVAQFAVATAGAVLVTLDPSYTARELSYVLGKAGVRLLLHGRGYRGDDLADVVAEARPSCPDLADAVEIGSPEWAALAAAGRAADPSALAARRAALRPGDAATIQFTSGTTGFPKGATLSHRNVLNNGAAVGDLLGYTVEDRVCVPVPLFHCFGMVMGVLAAVAHGACLVLPGREFEAGAVLSAVVQERCTSLYGVPTMFIAELAHPGLAGLDLSSLRTGIMSGSLCPRELMTSVVQRMGIRGLAICYGMTETSPVATQTRPGDGLERRVSTVGAPGPHVEVRVADPHTGETVPRGTPGEVCMRGYSVMLGYWEDPEGTAEAVDAEGWMHSGDLGVMDDDDYLRITGRIKDMVIRGGENVSPREVEEVLHTHPDVLDVQVIGVPDARLGEDLMAWLRLRPGAAPLDVDAVRAFCAGRLARHKTPRYVQVVDSFPQTMSGKVRKVELRQRGARLVA